MGLFELKNEESKQGSPLNSSIDIEDIDLVGSYCKEIVTGCVSRNGGFGFARGVEFS